MHVVKGAKGKNRITKHLKDLRDLPSISHFIPELLFLQFCSSFHAFILNAKVLLQLHWQTGRGNTFMLILLASL